MKDPMKRYRDIYEKMRRIGIFDVDEHERKKTEGFMDLVVEKLYKDTYSLTHYYEQNGDMMKDPDMTIRVDHENEIGEALTFEMSNPPIYQEVYVTRDDKKMVNQALKRDLNQFLNQWLLNLMRQGHTKYPRKTKSKAK